jgi:hypothetical protein
MPSRKQRRRREKLQRHEYEYVVETEEGEELQVERFRDVESEGRTGRNGATKERVPLDRRGRPMPKPSLRRALRRGAILAPLLVIFVYLTGGKLSTVGIILNSVVLIAFIVPLTYLLDTVMYRSVQRRQERTSTAKKR